MIYILRLLLKLFPIIISIFIIGSCSQSRKISCPVYESDFYTQKKGSEKYKKYKLKKSINSAYKTFYKTKNDETKNRSSKNNPFRKSNNSAVTPVIDFHDTKSANVNLYANNDKYINLENTLVPAFYDPSKSALGKPYSIVNKNPSRKDFKKNLNREIKRIKSENNSPDNDPGIKFARQSLLFGIIGIGSFLFGPIPILQYIVIPIIILFSILAITKGDTALKILDNSNYKSIARARTGKILGITALILLGLLLVIGILFLIFLVTLLSDLN
jgi:hypothetical protein